MLTTDVGFPHSDARTSLNVLEFIEGALVAARQGKWVDAWMDQVRTMSDSFYAATKATEGIDAAECELEKVVTGRKYREVAASVANIIAGAGVLAKVATERPLVELLARPPSVSLGRMLMSGFVAVPPRFLVVTNETPDFFRYDELRNSEIWSSRGALGLQAIIISACVREKHIEDVSVSLMLVPPVRFGYRNKNCEGYVLATLNAHGDTLFHTLTHKIRQHSSVRNALGKMSDDGLIESSSMGGGDPADHLGFPGSYEYLLSNLDGLGEYLTDLSVLMTKKK